MPIILNEFQGSYAKRTRFNCKSADFTLAIAFNFGSAGEILTFNAARPRIYQMSIEDYLNSPEEEVDEFCRKYRGYLCDTLHIAGNGASTLYKFWGLKYQMKADSLVHNILSKITQTVTIEKAYSGGQTGIDTAGVKSCLRLNIPVEVNMPQGYKIREYDGIDKSLSRQQTLKRFKV
jgi:hypothetical protein